MLEAREIAKAQDLEGSFHQKVDAMANIFNPVSKKLGGLGGKALVETMSVEAIELYVEVAKYWATFENFTAYNSSEWGTEQPPRSDPKNAVKCAAQKGKCQCPIDSIVYYGLKGSDGRLDTSQSYT